jgi:uncharacterized damage-inducible protein DinB
MNIKEQTNEILNQISELVSELSDEQYNVMLPILSNSSIGKHVRHIVEFYQCLTNGLSEGYVNYDKRERNLLLENNRGYTKNAIKIISNCIAIIQDNSLLLNTSHDNTVSTMNTSIFRELTYNMEHAIHHLAIIKIGIKNSFEEVNLSENMGVANSTILYQQQLAVK